MQNTINSRNEAPTTAQIMEILSKVHFKTKSKLLLLTCTGIRPTDVWYLKWIDFKWDGHPVGPIVPPYGKTRRGWESFFTDELEARLKIQNSHGEYIFTAGRENLRYEFCTS